MLLKLKEKVDSSLCRRIQRAYSNDHRCYSLARPCQFWAFSDSSWRNQTKPSQGLWWPLLGERACDRASIWRWNADTVDAHSELPTRLAAQQVPLILRGVPIIVKTSTRMVNNTTGLFVTSAADAESAEQGQAFLTPHETCRSTTKEIIPFVNVLPSLKVSKYSSLLPCLVEYYRLRPIIFRPVRLLATLSNGVNLLRIQKFWKP